MKFLLCQATEPKIELINLNKNEIFLGRTGFSGMRADDLDMRSWNIRNPKSYKCCYRFLCFIIKITNQMSFPLGFLWFQPNQIPEGLQNHDSLAVKYLLFWNLQKYQNENSAQIKEQLPPKEEKGSGNEVERNEGLIKHTKESNLLERDEQSGALCSKIERSQTNEYKPKKEKKKEPKKAVQSPQRNILPNILHQACCFIQMKKRSEKYVDRYFRINPSVHSKQVMVSRFYSYQKLMKERVNPYLNLNGLKSLNKIQEPDCQVFTLEEQQVFLKLTRALIKHFLENQLNSIIMTSIRMKGESRVWHLEWKRKILEALQNLFSEE